MVEPSVEGLVRRLLLDNIIGEDEEEVARFLLEYLENGESAVNSQERREWYRNLENGGCLENGKIVFEDGVDFRLQIALRVLCARGLVVREVKR